LSILPYDDDSVSTCESSAGDDDTDHSDTDTGGEVDVKANPYHAECLTFVQEELREVNIKI
jgi:hypothetical protein